MWMHGSHITLSALIFLVLGFLLSAENFRGPAPNYFSNTVIFWLSSASFIFIVFLTTSSYFIFLCLRSSYSASSFFLASRLIIINYWAITIFYEVWIWLLWMKTWFCLYICINGSALHYCSSHSWVTQGPPHIKSPYNVF